MKIAVTGAAGYVGGTLITRVLTEGHSVVGIDQLDASQLEHRHSNTDRFAFVQVDLRDYSQVLAALDGCEGVAHLAAVRTPGDGKVASHNNNASSINVIGLFWNEGPLCIDYLPLDEDHPCRPDDPYSLSKQICEAQADAIARRFPLRIASLRIHMVTPSHEYALTCSAETARKHLWGYTLAANAAHAFLLALTVGDTPSFHAGVHERFFIVEPEVGSVENTEVLVKREFPGVVVRGRLDGRRGLFDCRKADRVLGWRGG